MTASNQVTVYSYEEIDNGNSRTRYTLSSTAPASSKAFSPFDDSFIGVEVERGYAEPCGVFSVDDGLEYSIEESAVGDLRLYVGNDSFSADDLVNGTGCMCLRGRYRSLGG